MVMRHRTVSKVALVAGVAALAVGGCTTVKVQKQYTGSALPIPDRILVHDFSYSPSQIKLDRGISPRIEKAMKGTSRSYAELKAGEAVCDVVAEKLVQEIRDMGLPAQRGAVIRSSSVTRFPLRASS
jgi:hypothetical protein